MYIVTRRHLKEAFDRYPDAAIEIKAWAAIVEAVRWHNVRGYVVFNFRQKRYVGLITHLGAPIRIGERGFNVPSGATKAHPGAGPEIERTIQDSGRRFHRRGITAGSSARDDKRERVGVLFRC